MSVEAAQLEIRRAQYRSYPEETKAALVAAIEANNGNVHATAKLFDVPHDTAYYWWYNSDRYSEFQKRVGKLSLADGIELIAEKAKDSLIEHDFSIVTARDKAAILSVAVDKMQLLRGQPTSITESLDRQELTLVLQSALDEAIDVTPEST
jgi:transposase-like protein